MTIELKFDKDFVKKLNLALYEAIDSTFVQEIIMNTPVDTGITRNMWEFYPTGVFEYRLENKNGPVVLFLEKGTGIYGPRKVYIVPKNKKALRWYSRRRGSYVFAKKVKGIKPKHFIEDALNNPDNMKKLELILKKRLTKLSKK